MELAPFLESTLLHPAASKKDIQQLCEEAAELHFKGICINPYHVAFARSLLQNSKVKLVSVVGFPLGCTPARVKEEETKWAVQDGADEVDMVINIAALKDGLEEVLEEEIRRVVDCGVPVKGIIETGLLEKNEIAAACRQLVETGAKFVKTSTGFGPRGASLEDVMLLKSLLPGGVGIKASGGIRTTGFARQLIKAGADRIGTSSAAAIIEESRQEER